jgi:hypothetical protein
MPIDKIVIRKQPKQELFKAYTVVKGRTPLMRPLSEVGLPKNMAKKQKTAVLLSELRAAGRIPARNIPGKQKKKVGTGMHRMPDGTMMANSAMKKMMKLTPTTRRLPRVMY